MPVLMTEGMRHAVLNLVSAMRAELSLHDFCDLRLESALSKSISHALDPHQTPVFAVVVIFETMLRNLESNQVGHCVEHNAPGHFALQITSWKESFTSTCTALRQSEIV